jgi:hypothetical protein
MGGPVPSVDKGKVDESEMAVLEKFEVIED